MHYDDEDEYLKDTVEKGVFTPWQQVDVEVYSFSELGMTVSINDEYEGLVYKNEIFGDYHEGQKLKGYIKNIREDGRIDVSMQPQSSKHVTSTTGLILQYLNATGGKSSLNDKSSPEEIKDALQISKKVFKQAVGRLLKLKRITLTDEGIELVQKK